jgi:hypothetical protein
MCAVPSVPGLCHRARGPAGVRVWQVTSRVTGTTDGAAAAGTRSCWLSSEGRYIMGLCGTGLILRTRHRRQRLVLHAGGRTRQNVLD